MITPQPLMGRINRISRCFTLYRNNQLEQEGLNGYQHLYILWVCRRPGISQEQLVKEIYVHKSSVARQLALHLFHSHRSKPPNCLVWPYPITVTAPGPPRR